MLLFDMEEELSRAASRKVFEKLAWLSGVLREVDEWLESRNPPLRNTVEAHERSAITLENLDRFIARDRG
jgi:hypothetical protein